MKAAKQILAFSFALAAFVLPVSVSAALIDGLYQAWEFEETTGNRVDIVDSYVLVPTGSVGYSTGVDGNAVLLDSTDTQILSYDYSWLNYSSEDWSMSIWAKSTGDADTYRGLISNRAGSYSSWVTVGAAPTTGYLTFEDCGTHSVSIHDGEWHHYVITHDDAATDLLKVYKDGTQVISCSALNVGGTTNDLRLGQWFESPQFWDGSLDAFYVWNRVLGTDEITSLSEGLFYDFTAPEEPPIEGDSSNVPMIPIRFSGVYESGLGKRLYVTPISTTTWMGSYPASSLIIGLYDKPISFDTGTTSAMCYGFEYDSFCTSVGTASTTAELIYNNLEATAHLNNGEVFYLAWIHASGTDYTALAQASFRMEYAGSPVQVWQSQATGTRIVSLDSPGANSTTASTTVDFNFTYFFNSSQSFGVYDEACIVYWPYTNVSPLTGQGGEVEVCSDIWTSGETTFSHSAVLLSDYRYYWRAFLRGTGGVLYSPVQSFDVFFAPAPWEPVYTFPISEEDAASSSPDILSRFWEMTSSLWNKFPINYVTESAAIFAELAATTSVGTIGDIVLDFEAIDLKIWDYVATSTVDANFTLWETDTFSDVAALPWWSNLRDFMVLALWISWLMTVRPQVARIFNNPALG